MAGGFGLPPFRVPTLLFGGSYGRNFGAKTDLTKKARRKSAGLSSSVLRCRTRCYTAAFTSLGIPARAIASS